jgi:hypothetical protein
MFGGRLFFCSSPPTQHWQKKCFLSFFSSSVFLCLNVCLCVTWYCDNRFQNLCWKISDRNFRFLVIILKF